MSTTAPPIRLLPESVSARIRSTLTITNISDVISELLQNAIDAGARNVAIAVNLGRNSCVLEDDGHGVTPEGMLLVGREHATSKYPPAGDFGFRGQALSAICRHSLTTITSRADASGRTVMRRVSYGRELFTGAAPEHLELRRSGTVVRVEGLWGDMPVRVKVREGVDVDKEWDDTKRGIVMVLLSRGGVGVVVKDENGEVKVRVRVVVGSGWEVKVLKQVYAVGIDGWEKVVARMGGIGIEGRICTRGSASKGFQYFTEDINGYPVPMGTTLLHEEINRLFAASSFGVVEEDDGTKRLRGNPKKGADRWAMFVLRVECQRREVDVIGGEGGTKGKAGLEGDNLSATIGLLQRLIHEFLRTHYFRSTLATATKPQRGEGTTIRASPQSALDLLGESRPRTPLGVLRRNTNTASSQTKDTGKLTKSRDLGVLASWSRVKSARADPREEEGRQGPGFSKALTFSPAPLPAGSRLTPEKGRGGDSVDDSEAPSDTCFEWRDPVSQKTYTVNSRTGNTMTAKGPTSGRSIVRVGVKRPSSRDSFLGRRLGDDGNISKRACTEPLSEPKEPPGPFIESLLRTWENPVFKPTDAPIPQITLHTSEFVPGCAHPTTNSPLFLSTWTLGKLTKTGLRNAEVISQVDKKYILIKMAGITTSSSPDPSGLLVMVDQHAADERVRVEALFAELCSLEESPQGDQTRAQSGNLTYKISHREAELFTRHRASFSEWKIHYTIATNGGKEKEGAKENTLTITSLPRMVSDRCASEPSLMIDILRRHIPVLEDTTAMAHVGSASTASSLDPHAPLLSRCPTALVDMINSRACRSAIMFNDPLELDECRLLIGKLAECKFPFQCAHGRPSMIPLLDLGGVGTESGVGKVVTFEEGVKGKGGGFRKDFGRWVEREKERVQRRDD
ncbi:unnamed protein product [Tuber melanosporum]|uniref:(Perigord truffle) hypothetical protein n=1 Tax=Tuber melanosporum (strain Mel28) TaxID=656061 RepID=D5G994_TUBMM|nr:uncharacterized protein GSTUM_00003206001 [Tuber melanosporum]CAZ81087.1 unnamed protein product [Tuber melanosporum]